MRRKADEMLGKLETGSGERYVFGPPYPLDVYVPEEFVVNSPRLVAPQHVRAWRCQMWLLGGHIVEYGELCKADGFHGTSYFDEVICVETWRAIGDDGHVLFRHTGYRLILESELRAQLANWQIESREHGGRPLLPPFAEDED